MERSDQSKYCSIGFSVEQEERFVHGGRFSMPLYMQIDEEEYLKNPDQATKTQLLVYRLLNGVINLEHQVPVGDGDKSYSMICNPALYEERLTEGEMEADILLYRMLTMDFRERRNEDRWLALFSQGNYVLFNFEEANFEVIEDVEKHYLVALSLGLKEEREFDRQRLERQLDQLDALYRCVEGEELFIETMRNIYPEKGIQMIELVYLQFIHKLQLIREGTVKQTKLS